MPSIMLGEREYRQIPVRAKHPEVGLYVAVVGGDKIKVGQSGLVSQREAALRVQFKSCVLIGVIGCRHIQLLPYERAALKKLRIRRFRVRGHREVFQLRKETLDAVFALLDNPDVLHRAATKPYATRPESTRSVAVSLGSRYYESLP